MAHRDGPRSEPGMPSEILRPFAVRPRVPPDVAAGVTRGGRERRSTSRAERAAGAPFVLSETKDATASRLWHGLAPVRARPSFHPSFHSREPRGRTEEHGARVPVGAGASRPPRLREPRQAREPRGQLGLSRISGQPVRAPLAAHPEPVEGRAAHRATYPAAGISPRCGEGCPMPRVLRQAQDERILRMSASFDRRSLVVSAEA